MLIRCCCRTRPAPWRAAVPGARRSPRCRVPLAVQYVDHNTIQLDFKNPDDHRYLQAFCARYGIPFSRPGNGICHYVHLERFARPGALLIGADSHTTTSGAVGMLAIGAGGLEVAVALAGRPLRVRDARRGGRRVARPAAALGSGQGRHPRAAAPARRSRRPGPHLRVLWRGRADAGGLPAGHHLQHDRRAGRHHWRVPVATNRPAQWLRDQQRHGRWHCALAADAGRRLRRARDHRAATPGAAYCPAARARATWCRSARSPAPRSPRCALARRVNSGYRRPGHRRRPCCLGTAARLLISRDGHARARGRSWRRIARRASTATW